MPHYLIFRKTSAYDEGLYEGADAEAAYEKMVRDECYEETAESDRKFVDVVEVPYDASEPKAWYRFGPAIEEATSGWGTEEEASRYSDHLNGDREHDLHTFEVMGVEEVVKADLEVYDRQRKTWEPGNAGSILAADLEWISEQEDAA